MQNDLELYCEIIVIAQAEMHDGRSEEFVAFLRYCASRLAKGESVQTIWDDYHRG